MTDNYVQVATDGSGKKIDTSELTVNAQTVERQRVVIGDPTSPAGLADVTASGAAAQSTDNGLVVSVSPNSQVELAAAHQDAFGRLAIAQRQNDFECVFAGNNVNLAGLLSWSLTGSGGIAQANGQATFNTGAAPGTVDVRSLGNVNYRPGAELYAYFTAYWADSAAGTYQRIGLFDANNGFYVGYEGTTWGVTVRTGGVDTHISQGSFNVDTLTGTANSLFTRNAVPEAVNFTFQNVFRLRFGWVGSAPIMFEILAPDGNWVLFHSVRQPNTASTPSIQNPSLPMAVSMSDTGTSCTIGTSCWAAGSSSQFNNLNQTIQPNSLVLVTHAVTAGKTAAGGYVDQQVDSAGAIVVSPNSTISVKELQDAKSSDNAFSVFLTGDPSGEFAGVNLLESLVDETSGLAMGVKVYNAAKTDIKGVALTSDAPAPILISGLVGSIVVIDTTGYQSLNVTTQAYAGNVTCSDDGVNWQALSGINRTIAAAYVTAVTAANGFSFPCLARYIRFTCTTAGGAVAYLRNQPWSPGYSTPIPNNVAQLGGTNTVAASGVAGMLAVGGNIATGTTPTAGPVHVASLDTAGKTRPQLVDTAGRAILATDNQGTNRTLGMMPPTTNILSNALLTVRDGADFEGSTVVELLAQILQELRIQNVYGCFLSAQFGGIDDPTMLRNDPSLLM